MPEGSYKWAPRHAVPGLMRRAWRMRRLAGVIGAGLLAMGVAELGSEFARNPLVAVSFGLICWFIGGAVVLALSLLPALRFVVFWLILCMAVFAICEWAIDFGTGSVAEIAARAVPLAILLAAMLVPLPVPVRIRASRILDLPPERILPRLSPERPDYWDRRFDGAFRSRVAERISYAVISGGPNFLLTGWELGSKSGETGWNLEPAEGGTEVFFVELSRGTSLATAATMWLSDAAGDLLDDLSDTLNDKPRWSMRASEIAFDAPVAGLSPNG